MQKISMNVIDKIPFTGDAAEVLNCTTVDALFDWLGSADCPLLVFQADSVNAKKD